MIPRDQVRVCPGCRQERHVSAILDGLCSVCRLVGARYVVKHDAPSSNTMHQEATMKSQIAGEPRPCPKCGKQLKPNGYGPHVARCKAAGNVSESVDPIKRSIKPFPPKLQPSAAKSNGHDCAVCPLAGNHAEQDLFTQLVRGGLSLADAVARMAQARVVYAGTKGGA